MATAFAPKLFKNYINGEWVECRSGKAIENRNPANTEELVGMFPASGAEDVERCCRRGQGCIQEVAAYARAKAR